MRDAFYLDLRDQARVVDFLVEHLEYASGKEKTTAEEMIRAYSEGQHVPTDKLAESARRFAIAIWPIRFALKRFFHGEGNEVEWTKLLAAIRPSTAHLLNRLRKSIRAASVDEALKHEDADIALKDGEQKEIEEIRNHLRAAYWQEHQKNLATLVKEGEHQLKMHLGSLKSLRDIALDLPQSLQDEVFAKIAHFEDKIFFEGEEIPKEIFEEEVKYYVEQREVSPMDV